MRGLDRSQLDSQLSTLLTDDLVRQVALQIAPPGDPTAFHANAQSAGSDADGFSDEGSLATTAVDCFPFEPAPE